MVGKSNVIHVVFTASDGYASLRRYFFSNIYFSNDFLVRSSDGTSTLTTEVNEHHETIIKRVNHGGMARKRCRGSRACVSLSLLLSLLVPLKTE